jgi:hypothetical protein
MDLLKSRKFQLTIVGMIAIIVTIAICAALNVSAELTVQIVGWVAGFFGISLGGHIATDLLSIFKGLQIKK